MGVPRPASTRAALATALLWLVAVGLLDRATPPFLGLSYFYLPAAAFVTWHAGRRAGATIALVATVVWYLADAEGVDFPGILARAWNAGIRLAFFLTVVYLLAALRATLRRQDSLITELRDALAEVRTLRGLVPICAWCKKIRDDAGYWKSVESFIEAHTEAEFTHGMCPDCHERISSQR
ncbi:MAG: hypothetical protein H6746_04975 [Deltaproteobacteria bacterium]|nr:hypothetical protein [Deltaproteobacteria bacterium]